MKMVEVTLYGQVIVHCSKTFLLKMPEDFDFRRLDPERLSYLAVEEGVAWEGGQWHDYGSNEVDVSEMTVTEVNEKKGFTVLEWDQEVALTSTAAPPVGRWVVRCATRF